MRKSGLMVCIILLIFLSGCLPANVSGSRIDFRFTLPTANNEQLASLNQGSTVTDVTYPETVTISPCWNIYYSMSELDTRVDYVFEGKVVDIAFAVRQGYSGPFINSPPTGLSNVNLILYTIYEVEIEENYKGELDQKVFLLVRGGIEGYMEQEQFEKLKTCGWTKNGIQIIEDAKYLGIGKSYLFSGYKTENDYLGTISPYQFALEPGEVPQCGHNVLPSFDEIIAFYTNKD